MVDCRKIAAEIFAEAVSAVEGERLVRTRSSFHDGVWTYTYAGQVFHWTIPEDGRLLVVGAGKAAANLALGLEDVLGRRIDGGCIIVKYGHGKPLHRVEVFEASHPIPDAAGVAATEKLLELVSGLSANDRVFVAITGGASALLVAPAAGITWEEKAETTRLLLQSSANIEEINTVRNALSRVKGGGLLHAIAPAQSLTLLISDIPDDNPAMIGSGPMYPTRIDPAASLRILKDHDLLERIPLGVVAYLQSPHAVRPENPQEERSAYHIVLADRAAAVEAAETAIRERGFEPVVVEAKMSGDTHAAAQQFARAMIACRAKKKEGDTPSILLAAGETTLQVNGDGRGGRNQEFALVVAREISGHAGLCALAAGTDGTDGPTDAAGAFADGETEQRGGGLTALDAALAKNDSYTYFAAQHALFVTGPTGTNVMDLVIGVVGG